MLAVTNTSPWLIGSGSRKIDNNRSARASDAPGERVDGSSTTYSSPERRATVEYSGAALLRRMGDHLQHLVTGGVSEAVVDVLEAVEIDEVQRRMAVGLPRHAQAVVDPLEQEQAIGQIGECVGLCAHPQIVLRAAVGSNRLRHTQRDGAGQHECRDRPHDAVGRIDGPRGGEGDDGDHQ